MILGDLTSREVARRLQGRGLRLSIGPFTFAFKSPLPYLSDALHLLYTDFLIVDDSEFADFHVSVLPASGIRRWYRPTVTFTAEGMTYFKDVPWRATLAYFEWGLNRCIANYAHQYLMLHAAVVERDGRAMLIIGGTGAGKSTLCAAMALRNWRLLSDELALLSLQSRTLSALARPIILKNESIALLRAFDSRACFGPLCPETVKGTVAHLRPPSTHIHRVHETAVPAWCIFVKYQADASLQLHPVSKAQAVIRLAHQAFNYGVLGLQGFTALTETVDQCRCFELTYGQLEEALRLFDSAEFSQTQARQMLYEAV